MKKLEVTTKCPNCQQDFSRQVYQEQIFMGIGMLGLEICSDCLTTNEFGDANMIFVENKIEYSN